MSDALSWLITVTLLLSLYFTPTIVAYERHHNTNGVLIVNTLLGWTLIGWAAALIMACGKR